MSLLALKHLIVIAVELHQITLDEKGYELIRRHPTGHFLQIVRFENLCSISPSLNLEIRPAHHKGL